VKFARMDFTQINVLAVDGALVSTALAALKIWETFEVFKGPKVITEYKAGLEVEDERTVNFTSVTLYRPAPRSKPVISEMIRLFDTHFQTFAPVSIFPLEGESVTTSPHDVKPFSVSQFVFGIPIVREGNNTNTREFCFAAYINFVNGRLMTVPVCRVLPNYFGSFERTDKYLVGLSRHERRRLL
jgi:hypothetical protein